MNSSSYFSTSVRSAFSATRCDSRRFESNVLGDNSKLTVQVALEKQRIMKRSGKRINKARKPLGKASQRKCDFATQRPIGNFAIILINIIDIAFFKCRGMQLDMQFHTSI